MGKERENAEHVRAVLKVSRQGVQDQLVMTDAQALVAERAQDIWTMLRLRYWTGAIRESKPS